jgi:hypothetical protein
MSDLTLSSLGTLAYLICLYVFTYAQMYVCVFVCVVCGDKLLFPLPEVDNYCYPHVHMGKLSQAPWSESHTQ